MHVVQLAVSVVCGDLHPDPVFFNQVLTYSADHFSGLGFANSVGQGQIRMARQDRGVASVSPVFSVPLPFSDVRGPPEFNSAAECRTWGKR